MSCPGLKCWNGVHRLWQSSQPDPELVSEVHHNPWLLLELARTLSADSLLRASESCACWREAATDEDLWRELYHRDFQLSRHHSPSWRAAYREAATSHLEFCPTGREYDHLIKTLQIGDSGVGKTSFMTQFADDAFTEVYCSTIGIDFRVRTVMCLGHCLKLQMWDPGEGLTFTFGSRTSCYRGAQCIFIMYDITSRESFDKCEHWLQEVRRMATEHCVVGLVGCKCDLEQRRRVSFEEGEALAERWTAEAPEPRGPWSVVHFTETSSRKDIGVEKVMGRSMRSVVHTMKQLNEIAIGSPVEDISTLTDRSLGELEEEITKKAWSCAIC
eukprot:TRINITY_DN2251_c0_g4_i1.p1 TRINITY_DN2251_c0_g4~~TRINITY_DN2251_c0_g4_i1.p1  ORF type:complete len:329 (+),score=37.20 TRINITY_DN2251_c0_g4_i1:189-1175(+)